MKPPRSQNTTYYNLFCWKNATAMCIYSDIEFKIKTVMSDDNELFLLLSVTNYVMLAKLELLVSISLI